MSNQPEFDNLPPLDLDAERTRAREEFGIDLDDLPSGTGGTILASYIYGRNDRLAGPMTQEAAENALEEYRAALEPAVHILVGPYMTTRGTILRRDPGDPTMPNDAPTPDEIREAREAQGRVRRFINEFDHRGIDVGRRSEIARRVHDGLRLDPRDLDVLLDLTARQEFWRPYAEVPAVLESWPVERQAGFFDEVTRDLLRWHAPQSSSVSIREVEIRRAEYGAGVMSRVRGLL